MKLEGEGGRERARERARESARERERESESTTRKEGTTVEYHYVIVLCLRSFVF